MEETSIELQSEAMSIVSEIVLTILDDIIYGILRLEHLMLFKVSLYRITYPMMRLDN